ncbi:hypothetical protein ACFYVL_01450 [Streptomyces sp. NPDC004111]|uniref:hypothetical protein n=1 Tax=Streptomyces sp. NPDC004111 TaxID=3364690 RepID=UPI003682862F
MDTVPQTSGPYPQQHEWWRYGSRQGVSMSLPQGTEQESRMGRPGPGQSYGRQLQQESVVFPSAVDSRALVRAVATNYWDVPAPLPGQPSVMYLFVNGNWHQLQNVNQSLRSQIQEAFALGHQVVVVYDNETGLLLAVVVNKV